VAIYRELAGTLPDRYRPEFTRALNNLGIRYLESGRLSEALAPAEEAVALYR